MLSHRAPGLCKGAKYFRIVRRGFARVQNTFASCAVALQGCKMLSHRAPGFCKGTKCFRIVRRDFTRV